MKARSSRKATARRTTIDAVKESAGGLERSGRGENRLIILLRRVPVDGTVDMKLYSLYTLFQVERCLVVVQRPI